MLMKIPPQVRFAEGEPARISMCNVLDNKGLRNGARWTVRSAVSPARKIRRPSPKIPQARGVPLPRLRGAGARHEACSGQWSAR
jgi:hypothetical protein